MSHTGNVNVNVDERIKQFMARREYRNPGMKGTQARKPSAKNWKHLINDTTRRSVMKSLIKSLRTR